MTKRMSVTALRRTVSATFLLIIMAMAFGLGAWSIPGRPWAFTHLTPGSFVGAYADAQQCRDVQRSFAAGRGIGLPLGGSISGGYLDGYIDSCSRLDAPENMPGVTIEIQP